MSVNETAENVQSSIEAQTDAAPDLDDVVETLSTYTSQYGIPEDEAARAVIDDYVEGDAADSAKSAFFGSGGEDGGQDGSEHGLVSIADIPSIGDEEWVDVRGKIVQMWNADHESIAAKFLIADESDETLPVTVWQKSADNNDFPSFEEGATLEFGNVVTEEYQGDYSVKVNSDSTVAPVEDDDFDPDQNQEIAFSAQFVDYRDQSGLIKRCPEDDCSRVLENSRCKEHGQMDDFEWDLRVKAIIDDGQQAVELILDEEQTAAIIGMSMEDAQALAREHTDTEAVIQEMASRLMGKTLAGEATPMGHRLIANSVALVEDAPDAEDALQSARA
jgi:replication factor A1